MTALLALLALPALAADPLDVYLSLRTRYTLWVEDVAGGHSVLLEFDDTLPDDQNAVFVSNLDLDPALYQIVDVSIGAMDTWYVRALVDFDPEAQELGRLAGQVGFKQARIYLETGLTTGRLNLEPDVIPDRILVPTEAVEIQYRMLAVAVEVEPGVRGGVGTASWTLPTTLELFSADAAYDSYFDDYSGQFAVVDPSMKYEMFGFFMEIRNIDRILVDDPDSATRKMLFVDEDRFRMGAGVELTALIGLTRTVPDYGRYDEWVAHTGLRPDLRSAFGIGSMGSLRAALFAGVLPGKFRMGVEAGFEAREHILLAVNPGGEGKPAERPGTAYISYGGLLPMAVFYGPYAGVTAVF